MLKRGDNGVVSNNGSISMLCSAMEKCLYGWIYTSMFLNIIIIDVQLIFVYDWSSTNFIFEGLSSSRVNFSLELSVKNVYLDSSKAFDCVSHDLFINNLTMYGIAGKLLLWLHGYITNLQICVAVER